MAFPEVTEGTRGGGLPVWLRDEERDLVLVRWTLHNHTHAAAPKQPRDVMLRAHLSINTNVEREIREVKTV